MDFNHWWQHHTLSKERNIAQLGQNPVKVVAEIAFTAGYLQAAASQPAVQADARKLCLDCKDKPVGDFIRCTTCNRILRTA